MCASFCTMYPSVIRHLNIHVFWDVQETTSKNICCIRNCANGKKSFRNLGGFFRISVAVTNNL